MTDSTKFDHIDSISEMESEIYGLLDGLDNTCPKTCGHKEEVSGLLGDLRAAIGRLSKMKAG